ncbi:hypothetical protein FSP39_008413 [Pinctada imbricata]|uniref:Uncharacterized protein n=1 Tax=Pinctada imbricata TaxID=66713 RepID=A0AA88YBR1_PINIB|nr:hypothetical protein FSP39_008413 [Pinctada imbricata]
MMLRLKNHSVVALLVLTSIPPLILVYLTITANDCPVELLGRSENRTLQRIHDGYMQKIRQIQHQEKQIQKLRRKLSLAEMQLQGYQNGNNISGFGDNRTNGRCANNQLHVPKCQVIDIAIVCTGINATRDVVTVIKSILFYRKNPLHFHFIADVISQKILHHLFTSWNVAEVETSFYSSEKAKPRVSWIPNIHYSGVYGLMKLTLTEILPQYLDKVIVVDIDVTFATDVAELWKILNSLQGLKMIGLVENLSDWYLGLLPNVSPWPADGRGFNTGVMLMNLKKLRELNWMDTWRTVTEKVLPQHEHTQLADQDIINAVIKQHPFLVSRLSCKWNVQLSDNRKECSGDLSSYKIIHWNSPKKYNVKHQRIGYFRNLHQMFLEYDGNLLKREISWCNTTGSQSSQNNKINLTEINTDDECYDFRIERILEHRTHLYYLDYDLDYRPEEFDVSLVVQLSMDRLQMLETISKHWEGPISLALYIADAEIQQFLRFAHGSDILMKRRNIGYHLVFRDGQYFPVNYLRNVALRQVVTPYVFLSDVDFLPMHGLYDYLKKALSMMDMQSKSKALIVPAFETQRYRTDFPESKADLLNKLDLGDLFTFRFHVWPRGHAPTDYTKWRTATTPYTVQWDFDFEPYVVVKRDIPEFDQRFVGFGWNKVSHTMELDVLGYEFVVLPNAFMIHMPHAPSFDIAKFRSSSLYRRCLKVLKYEYQRDLSRKYGIKALKYLSDD